MLTILEFFDRIHGRYIVGDLDIIVVGGIFIFADGLCLWRCSVRGVVRPFALIGLVVSAFGLVILALSAAGIIPDFIIPFFQTYLSPDGFISHPFLLYSKIGFLVLVLGFYSWLFLTHRDVEMDYLSQFPAVLFTVSFIISVLFICERYHLVNWSVDLFREDGLFEDTTVILLLLTSLLFLQTGRSLLKVNENRFVISIHFFISLMAFLAMMEEISWGQRIFDIETPAILAGINYQGELNLHNLFNPVFGFAYFFIGATVCAGTMTLVGMRSHISSPGVIDLIPHKRYFFISLFYFVLASFSELFEVVISIFLFSYALDVRQNVCVRLENCS